MRDDDLEYERSRAEENFKRQVIRVTLGALGWIIVAPALWTWIDNAGRPHRWAAFFNRLGIDYWSSPTLQWLFN